MRSNCLSAKGRVHWDRLKHTSASGSIPVSSGAVSWPKVALHHTLWLFMSRSTFVYYVGEHACLSTVLCQLCQFGKTALRSMLGLLGGWLQHLPMPVSPSCVSGISVFPFRTCRSLDELWIFLVWQATHEYGRAARSETTKTSSTLQACFFRFLLLNPFLELCPSNPVFSSIILFYMFVQAFDALKISEHRFGTRDTLNLKNLKVICLSIQVSQVFFLLLCHFHMNWQLNAASIELPMALTQTVFFIL